MGALSAPHLFCVRDKCIFYNRAKTNLYWEVTIMAMFDYSKETANIRKEFCAYLMHAGVYADDWKKLSIEFERLLKRVEDKSKYSHLHDEVVSGL